MQIHDGGNDEHLIQNRVDQGVRKLFYETAVEGAVQRCPSGGKVNNPFNGCVHLLREDKTKTSLLELVVFNAVQEFFPGGLGELEPHFWNLSLIS